MIEREKIKKLVTALDDLVVGANRRADYLFDRNRRESGQVAFGEAVAYTHAATLIRRILYEEVTE